MIGKDVKANHAKEAEIQHRVLASIQTDSGCIRDVNEDRVRFIRPNDSDLLSKKGTLTIVADGMGGHSAGEVASSIAVETVSRVYYEADCNAGESLKAAFAEANRQIYESSNSDETLKGMGTTCTALVLHNSSALAAYVGDSRLYLLRGGEIYLMTEDHSVVMEMVKRGIINMEQARNHEDKNVIVRALGTAPQVQVSIWANPLAIRDDDQFILCSDGLTDLVEDAEIKDVVLLASDNHSACENLIDLAKKRGGYDNISVGILTIKPAGYVETKDLRETREAEVVL